MKPSFTLTMLLLLLICWMPMRSDAQKCGAIYADDDVVLAAIDTKLYRSTDGGISFSQIKPAGEDDLEIRCISKVNSTLIIGGINGSRIFRSTDKGATWSVANSGMPVLSGVVIAVPSRSLASGGRVIMGGTNFTRYSDDDGLSWKSIPGLTDNTSAISATAGKLWHSSIYGLVSYSSDNGSTWTATTTKPYFLGISGRGFVQFGDTLVALSDKNAGAAVDRSYDYGATWKPAGSLSLGLDMVEVGGTLYATSNDGLMKSTDHGINWTGTCGSFKYYAYGGKMCVHGNDIWIASGNGILKFNTVSGTCNLSTPTSIASAAKREQISLYPNPAHEQVRVNNLSADMQVTLSDISGKPCYQQTTTTSELLINTRDLADGLYLLRISSETATSVHKLLIHH